MSCLTRADDSLGVPSSTPLFLSTLSSVLWILLMSPYLVRFEVMVVNIKVGLLGCDAVWFCI
jgi:hypothetical protein